MQSIKFPFHMSENAFFFYEKETHSLTKLCDLSLNPEQSFYYIIEDKKKERIKSIEAAGCGHGRRGSHPY